jgi:hypothetical protein
MSSAGVISITCPSFAGAGLVNYALNAPAVGATFPLEISALRITQDTIAAARLPVVVPGTSAGVVAAAGLPGNTTGSAIAAGYVGFNVRSQSGSLTMVAASGVVGVTSIFLPAGGTYLLSGTLVVNLSADTTCSLIVSDVSATNTSLTGIVAGQDVGLAAQTATGKIGIVPTLYYQCSSSKTIYLNIYRNAAVSVTSGFYHISATLIA